MSTAAQKSVQVLAALLLVSCAGTKLVDHWRDPAWKGSAYKKVLVFGISEQPNVRQAFENEFVKKIKEQGADAVPGHRFIPEAGKVDKARVLGAVEQSGADAVMVTRLVKRENVIKPTRPSAPTPEEKWGGMYSDAWATRYEPTATTTETVVILETKLWDVKTQAPVWTGTSEVTNPSPKRVEELTDSLSKAMIASLRESGML